MNTHGQGSLQFDPTSLVTALKAVAEPTRLRILVLLHSGELNVKDLTVILGQSQPRLSRHLKLLHEAGLIERFREGSWAYFYISTRTVGGQLASALVDIVDRTDDLILRDRERAQTLKRERESNAQSYFERHADNWDEIRSLHVPEADVEAAVRSVLDDGLVETFVDLGTGTGRMLALFADRYRYGIGIDVNQAMLAYARAKLAADGVGHAHVRHGDLYSLPLASGEADVVVMHQVLHFLSEPHRAIAEACRVLRSGGQVVVVDFLPHELEFLREEHAHERLGFSDATMRGWLSDAGFATGDVTELAAASGSDAGAREGLTVAIWHGRKTGASGAHELNNGNANVLEEI